VAACTLYIKELEARRWCRSSPIPTPLSQYLNRIPTIMACECSFKKRLMNHVLVQLSEGEHCVSIERVAVYLTPRSGLSELVRSSGSFGGDASVATSQAQASFCHSVSDVGSNQGISAHSSGYNVGRYHSLNHSPFQAIPTPVLRLVLMPRVRPDSDGFGSQLTRCAYRRGGADCEAYTQSVPKLLSDSLRNIVPGSSHGRIPCGAAFDLQRTAA
jgi:hypothetical protein